ncbi:hypothetical protein CIRG_05172 [Coccidioides immitis RMSCC 2394]|uniref:Uncharacterized protein n=1 Tax=Coccidioides immitis RMSCC 2394 TaxID=404692 RepID=A0A0J6Y9Y8_COCIT|nr:hypothetical protein CIRG_05172 [Coccidioides immitis RMSCC 2394]
MLAGDPQSSLDTNCPTRGVIESQAHPATFENNVPWLCASTHKKSPVSAVMVFYYGRSPDTPYSANGHRGQPLRSFVDANALHVDSCFRAFMVQWDKLCLPLTSIPVVTIMLHGCEMIPTSKIQPLPLF